MRKATLMGLYGPGKHEAALPELHVSSVRFDLIAAALSTWLVVGIYLDGWAHIHVPGLETFFTPWHGALYSGLVASGLFLLLVAARNIARGFPLQRCLPAGYGLSLGGAGLFLVGGLADLGWHTVFGIEANVEALLSPTHLLLALGGILLMTGPLRAAGHRARAEDRAGHPAAWVARPPMLLSLAYLLSVCTFFTEYASPFAQTLAARGGGSGLTSYRIEGLALASILLQSALLMGVVLLALRRFRLPFGSLVLILGLNTTLMTLMHNGQQDTGPVPLIAAAVLAGLAGDALRLWLQPSGGSAAAFRAYSVAVPLLLYAFYFAALQLFGGGIAWRIHMWAGAIVLAGVAGWLLSYAYLAPAAWQE